MGEPLFMISLDQVFLFCVVAACLYGLAVWRRVLQGLPGAVDLWVALAATVWLMVQSGLVFLRLPEACLFMVIGIVVWIPIRIVLAATFWPPNAKGVRGSDAPVPLFTATAKEGDHPPEEQEPPSTTPATYHCRVLDGTGTAAQALMPMVSDWATRVMGASLFPGTLNLCAGRDVTLPNWCYSLQSHSHLMPLAARRNTPGYDPRLYDVMINGTEPGWVFRWSGQSALRSFVGDGECRAEARLEVVAKRNLRDALNLSTGSPVNIQFVKWSKSLIQRRIDAARVSKQ